MDSPTRSQRTPSSSGSGGAEMSVPDRTRTLIVSRDEATGYGLTLSGDRPVFVQTVRPGGAADRAGVREKDVIVKVNGARVTQSTHTEVVDLISASKYVALTVIQAPSTDMSKMPSSSSPPPLPPTPSSAVGTSSPSQPRSSSQSPSASSSSRSQRITAPQPANKTNFILRKLSFGRSDKKTDQGSTETDAVRALTGEKMHTMQLMVEQERRYVEQLRQDMACANSAKLQQELEQAVRRLGKLEEQLEGLKAGKTTGRPQSTILPSRTVPVPSVPPRPDLSPAGGSASSLPPSSSLVPPPLPARNNRSSMSSLVTAGETTPTLSANPPPLPPPRQQQVPLPPPPPIPLPPTPGSSDKRMSHESSHKSPRRSKTGVAFSPQSSLPHHVSSSSTLHHERTRSSPSSLLDFSESGPGGRVSPRYETPPGTPPPPYHGNTPTEFNPDGGSSSGLATWNILGESGDAGIINMEDEDDDLSDQELGSSSGGLGPFVAFGSNIPGGTGDTEVQSPFDNLRDLMCHHAHLSVLMNYVISNSDPASLFFYLITETYKMGTVKEMQKWAYEIHSSFLVPDAPLRVPNVEQAAINEIDRALQEDFDKEAVLRKLFWKGRTKARVQLKEQLAEFRERRAAGLGLIFGPADKELKLCIENRNKELQVIDDLLLPVLESLSDDLENTTDRSLTIASSLATVLGKTFNARSQAAHNLIEKCPTFVSKEKRAKIFSRNKKTLQVQGHHFELKQYFELTYCKHSQDMIWGIGPQGYKCSHCGFDVHKKYVQRVEETCVGPSCKKSDRKSRNMFSRILSDKDLPNRKSSSSSPIVTGGKEASPSFRVHEDVLLDDTFKETQGESKLSVRQPSLPTQDTTDNATATSHTPNNGNGENTDGATSNTPTGNKSDSPAKTSGSADRWPSLRNQAGILPTEQPRGTKVDRSQSCKLEKKDPKRGATRERRKHSDPSIPRSATSDVDSDAPQPIADHQSGSSSTSSLSARSSLDSPSSSLQEMAGGRAATTTSSSVSTLTTTVPSADSTLSTATAAQFHPQTCWDSDFETEPDPPDWRLTISQEELAKLKPKERKRQDVINEFFHTEKSHVRNLKVLERLFYKPLLESTHMTRDFVERLFPNLDEVLSVHNQYNQKMKEQAKSGFPIGEIGDMLSEMFDGSQGERLVQVCSEFTKNQKMSVEELKERRKREHQLDKFLTEQERRPECRRLQLQSILPVEHQRLVKYPLLLKELAKQCDKEEQEYTTVKRCEERTREILESIDKQVAEAENIQRLAEIQKNLDTSGLEKMPDSPICVEYKNLDLTRHRLIYDGALTMKLGETRRFKTIDLHVVLLEDCIMLLQKQDDKYLLKFHTSTASNAPQGNSGKFCHSPVIKFSTMLVRPVATDKRAFYLLNTTQNGPQIYELVASSTADRAQWFRHITEASNAYRARDTRRGFRGGAASTDSPSSHNGLGMDAGGDRGKSDDHLGVPDLLGDKKGQPAGRSQSFHEQSTSSREPHHERQPSSPPEDRGELDTLAKKTGDDGGSGGHRKRFQRVEILKIAEPCPLIDPSQVVVTQGEILVADPVLTPIEKLRRKDMEVAKALEEKQRLIADILHIPMEDFDHIVDIASQPTTTDRDAREVLLAALAQAKSLSDLVNESLSLSEEDTVVASTRLSSPPPTEEEADVEASELATVPSLSSLASSSVSATGSSSTVTPDQTNVNNSDDQSTPITTPVTRRRVPSAPHTGRLVAITSSMNQHLTSLLAIIQDRDEERERLRRELQRSQEQVHALLSQSSVRTSSLSVTSPASRPASFISVEESSGPELSERNHESEDDVALAGQQQQQQLSNNDSTSTSDEVNTTTSTITDTKEESKKAATKVDSEPTAAQCTDDSKDNTNKQSEGKDNNNEEEEYETVEEEDEEGKSGEEESS